MSHAAKRALDVVVASGALLLFSPVMALSALGVRLFMGAPVLLRQQRPGQKGRPFVLLKFRTMTDDRNPAGELLPDAQRITRLGRLLRAWSLDELPQFWNVLKGEMSLVGPRPLLMQYLERYTPEQARRHDVPPGITGWAQVNGRNATTWEQRFAADLWYVDHWSLGLDLRILARTLGNVLRREGATARGGPTMPEFMGNAPTMAKQAGRE